jgi:trk system potassium uptake protein TrkH
LVILGTVGLWVLGAASMLLFEIGNPSTLGNEPFGSQITNASFQVITARTAGFSTIDFSATRPGNSFLFMLLMFIGGASGSAAGGIKVNTAMVLLAASLASINGRPHAEVLKRELAYTQVSRALALLLLATTVLFFIATALAVTEVHQIEQGKFTFLDVLFESASAFGTSGLSRGITSLLTEPGKIVVTLAMVAGRLGPLTIALGLALHERRAIYRFAEERVRIG